MYIPERPLAVAQDFYDFQTARKSFSVKDTEDNCCRVNIPINEFPTNYRRENAECKSNVNPLVAVVKADPTVTMDRSEIQELGSSYESSGIHKEVSPRAKSVSNRKYANKIQEPLLNPLVVKLEPGGLTEFGDSWNNLSQPLLKFQVKKESEEETRNVIGELVGCLPRNLALEDCKPFQVLHSENNLQHHSLANLNSFSSSATSTQKEPIGEAMSHDQSKGSKINFNSRNIQVKAVSVQLEDLFPKSSRKLGLMHTNSKSCQCEYCQGFFCAHDSADADAPQSSDSNADPEYNLRKHQRNEFQGILKDQEKQNKKKNHQRVQKSGKKLKQKQDTAKGSQKINFCESSTSRSDEKLFECAHCLAKFKKRCSVIAHLKFHQNKQSSRSKKKSVKPGTDMQSGLNEQDFQEKKYKCDMCSKVFYQKNELENHNCAPIDDRLFRCDVCSKAFNRKGTLENHQRVHNADRPFKCKSCPTKFKSQYNLSEHLRLHDEKESLKCEYCAAKFNFRSNLKLHLRKHTGETPFACNECPLKFRSSSSLKSHFRAHSDKRPFKCRKCSKRFKTISVLNVHKLVHSGAQPFKCTYCPAKFSQSGNLTFHLKTHTGKKPFKCNECPAKFIAKHCLRQHILKIHNDVKPFACKLCSGTFLSKGSMKRHQKIHAA